MDFNSFKLDTKFGTVTLTVVNGGCIRVWSGPDSAFTVNNTACHLSMHLSQYDGRWLPQRNKEGREEPHSLRLRKAAAKLAVNDGASRSAYRKVREEILSLVDAWAAENSSHLFAAEVDALELDLSSKRDLVTGLLAKLEAAKADVAAAEAKLAAVRGIAS